MFDRIIFCYSEWQSGYKEFGSHIEFKEDLPQNSDYAGDLRTKFIIVNDLMSKASSSGALINLFTKGSHHNNCSVMFITQNVFHQGRGQRDIPLNAHYIVVF